jgi:endonuclease YncB( thermonuclease family)
MIPSACGIIFLKGYELFLGRYGRTLAVIYVNGIDANLEQVRSGMA